MSANPRRRPLHDDIDEAMIERLVRAFYVKVRADAELGPIFAAAIPGDWEPHLAKMCDFWSSVMLLSGRYKGAPMVAHMRLKSIRPEHFARWLALFRETAAELCPAEIAALFVSRAENIAKSLQLGLFFRPEARAPRPPALHPVRPRQTPGEP